AGDGGDQAGRRPRRAVARRPQRGRQVAALDVLHGEVRLAFALADVIDGDDVRVVEVGGGLGLQAEAGQVLGERQLAGPDHLEGDDAAEGLVTGLVDDAHATLGDLVEQFVLADDAAGRQRGPGV